MIGDIAVQLQERVREAIAARQALNIVGGATKTFYGQRPEGAPLSAAGHAGIVDYSPSEMVLTARGGTPLAEIERVLASERQMLGFEPPHFGAAATLGGTIACGFSGPRRPYAGAARDFVLGANCIAGTGEILRFGGRVMKNVAGYDVSRLLTGSLGTLGLLLELSLRVVPAPEEEVTLVRAADIDHALSAIACWGAQPLPVSAAAFDGEQLWIRLSGSSISLKNAQALIGGELDPAGPAFWTGLREQTLPFFQRGVSLWRLSLAPGTPPLNLPGQWLYDWGGAQRWLTTEASAVEIRMAVSAVGGHATLFRSESRQDVFHPLSSGLLSLHKRLKDAFDPHGIMNPRRIYPE